jgi:tRNA(adenine34) deaminase
MNEDEKWMKIALQEALKAEKENEVPVGAILIKDNFIIARAFNQPISTNDATAHAEIQLIKKAGQKIQNYRLNHSTLYVTLEPCAMCFGAMIHARINRVVFGASDYKSGVCGTCVNFSKESYFNHKVKVTGGILEKECKDLLQRFFKMRRNQRSN